MTDCLAAMMVHPTEDIFYHGEQWYPCMNWCYHFNQAFAEGREDTIIEVLATDVVTHHLENLASSSLECWVNTLIHNGWQDLLDDLTSLSARLKVCTMCVICYAETI